jgi:hypothetical protein
VEVAPEGVSQNDSALPGPFKGLWGAVEPSVVARPQRHTIGPLGPGGPRADNHARLATFRRKIPFFRLAVNRAAQSKARRGVTGGLKIV